MWAFNSTRIYYFMAKVKQINIIITIIMTEPMTTEDNKLIKGPS